MNRYNFKNRFVLLLLGFSLFYIQASGKSDIENQLSVKSEQEALPQDHQTYTQPADGLRFTTKNTTTRNVSTHTNLSIYRNRGNHKEEQEEKEKENT